MNVADWTGLGGLALGIAGALVAYGQVLGQVKTLREQRATDQENLIREFTDLKGRVERAEAAATEVKGLAQAVEHMGERFSAELKHLAETMTMQLGHVREQMEGLKSDNLNIRRDLRERRTRTTKGTSA